MNTYKYKERMALPMVASPMFLVSGPDLVIACCTKNIIGSFPSVNLRTTLEFEQWVVQINDALDAHEKTTGKAPAPFAVNLVVHRTNPRYREDLEICIKHKVPIIITSLGAAKEVVDAVHGYGGIVYHDVANAYHAKKAADAGVDGIIAICGGAGGHSGAINPFALLGEIRMFYDGILLLGGSISTGRDIAAALQMGADMAYMGTRFINTKESQAVDEYKQMIIESSAKDIVYTPAVSGIKANFLRASLEEAGYDMEQLMNPSVVNYGEKLSPPKEGTKAWVNTWSAGHGCSVIKDIPTTADLIDRLIKEFKESIADQEEKITSYIN